MKQLKKISFWTREFRLPLFWLTDKGHNIFRENVLALYKNSVLHCYHLNNRELRTAEEGYKFFTNKRNLLKYEKQAEEIRGLIKQIADEYKEIKVKDLSNTELKNRFFDILGFLNLYSNLYTKTEPFVLSKIEADEIKYKKLIKKLGVSRFILRKQGESLFYNLFGVLLKELARRFNLKVSDLFFYKYDDIVRLFRGRKTRKDVIEKRKKGYALISLKNKKILLTGEKFTKLYKKVVLVKLKTDQLIGQIAMGGNAKGRVRIILHNKRNITKNVARFEKGEVLVTEMTRPDTVLACKKASAIVTDEGGITSHAAILSRELKIPCVIGTKIATKILKDGSVVEVDATHGIVNIIKT